MSTFAGVATDLCSVLLQLNQPIEALQQLERGRAIIISNLLDIRSDLFSLEQKYPEIAHRYQGLQTEINKPLQYVEQVEIRKQDRACRTDMLAELDVCIGEIRLLPGYERFLLGQQIAEMQKCAEGGTIFIVNITLVYSGAIIVSPTAIKALSLPRRLGVEAPTWLGEKWFGVPKEERPKKQKKYLEYLAWLWNVCVKPIINEAVSRDANYQPRIWWVGSGLASSMPLHAAGIYIGDSKENALNRVVSLYTPSIKALSHARRRDVTMNGTEGTFLITTMPTTPGNYSLGVEDERKQSPSFVQGRLPVTHPDLPSVQDVVDALPQRSIAHFACHGTTDYVDPSQSGLILHKGTAQDRLTVQRVSELDLRNARIAYLSACSTAENKAASLLDEVIHVVSGFPVAGFPHVIGCLWPSNDRVCVQVAARFYWSLFEDRTDFPAEDKVAWALREAVIKARDAELGMPLYWAPYVHFGA